LQRLAWSIGYSEVAILQVIEKAGISRNLQEHSSMLQYDRIE